MSFFCAASAAAASCWIASALAWKASQKPIQSKMIIKRVSFAPKHTNELAVSRERERERDGQHKIRKIGGKATKRSRRHQSQRTSERKERSGKAGKNRRRTKKKIKKPKEAKRTEERNTRRKGVPKELQREKLRAHLLGGRKGGLGCLGPL